MEQRVLPAEGDIGHHLGLAFVDDRVPGITQRLGHQRPQLRLAGKQADSQSFSNWATSRTITVAPPTCTSTG